MAIFRQIKLLLTALFKDHSSALLFYVLMLLLLYGYHGDLDLLKLILPQWSPPGCDASTSSDPTFVTLGEDVGEGKANVQEIWLDT